MAMQDVLRDLEVRMQAAVDLLAREFSGVRTGRANTALLDAVRVEAYGAHTPINQMASVSVPDPKTLLIQPWDASQIASHREGDPERNVAQGCQRCDPPAAGLHPQRKRTKQEGRL